MKSIITIITIIFILMPRVIYADWLYSYMDMECDPEKETAVLIPSTIYNVENSKSAECIFKSGGKIKAKFGTAGEYDYFKWISLWVNETRILSKQSISCDTTDGPCNLYVKANEDNFSICKLDYTKPFYKPPNIESDFICETTLIKNLPNEKDLVEYPPAGEPRYQVGDTEIFYAADRELCNQFISNNSFIIPEKAKRFSGLETTKNITRFQGDLNNDGITDEAYSIESFTRYIRGTSYFIFPKDNPIKSQWPDIDVKTLDKFKKHVFPDQWGGCSKSGGCPYDKYNYLELLVPEPKEKRITSLQPRYLESNAINLDGTTLFIISSYEAFYPHLSLLLKPLPDGTAEHMCYFRKIEEHY